MLAKIKATRHPKKKILMATYRLRLAEFLKLKPAYLGTFFLYITPYTAQFFMQKFSGIVQHHTGKALHILFKALPLSSNGLTYSQGYFCQAADIKILEGILHSIITRGFLPSEALVSCLVGVSFVNLWPKAALSDGPEQSSLKGVLSLLDVVLVHRDKQGIFLLYRLLSKVLHFFTSYFTYASLWPSIFTGQLTFCITQSYTTKGMQPPCK